MRCDELYLGFLYEIGLEIRRYVEDQGSPTKSNKLARLSCNGQYTHGNHVATEKISNGKRDSASAEYDIHQRDGRMTWLGPRVSGGCESLPTEATGYLWARLYLQLWTSYARYLRRGSFYNKRVHCVHSQNKKRDK